MYIFEAHYINDNNEEITRVIEFDEQFFDNEKECYLYAMSKAYDMIEEKEMFTSLVFIVSIHSMLNRVFYWQNHT